MSASAVLNLIAPSAPLPFQAPGDADASIFGDLLSDVGAGDDGSDDSVPPQPTTLPPRTVSKPAGKTVAVNGSAPATLIDPTGLGTIQTLPPVPADETAVTKATDVALTLPGAAAETDLPASGVGAKTDDQPPVMPLPIGPTPVVANPSATGATAPTPPVLPDTIAADAAEAALLAAAAEALKDTSETDDSQTLPPAATDKTASTTPPAPQVQPPAAAPLKRASERTGRTQEGLTREGSEAKGSVDGTVASASASTASAASAPTPGKAPADASTVPPGPAALTGQAEPSGDLNTDGTTASLDTAKAHAETAVNHDASLSTLSRATIDATAQIAAQIIRKLDGKSTRFEMALTPDDLGRVDVKLEIDAEGRLAARMTFDNPAAAADLRGRADELRRQLQDAGFHVPDDAFEFAERDSGSSAFDRGASDHNDNQRQNRAFSAASRLNAEIDVAQPPRWMSLSLSPSGVDLKV
ncbi:flagellar hook-length control protein FliK [uncultured Brevundimonas sp.]|uniref:flagellar hook-length control protein FliK n=1 Tax=uncultured Brevundimonas sp. TaxID=213418 RepID=UPI0025D90E67|nr:flagellar hook-length control protein FliK [uncultured Brevundimonas sp.]